MLEGADIFSNSDKIFCNNLKIDKCVFYKQNYLILYIKGNKYAPYFGPEDSKNFKGNLSLKECKKIAKKMRKVGVMICDSEKIIIEGLD